MLKIKSILVLLFFATFSLGAEVKIPKAQHFNDLANKFTSGQEATVISLLKEFNKKTKATMYVIVLDSLEGETIDGFNNRILNQWVKDGEAPGDKERDDGLLLTIAIKDRKVRLDVGQGLEGDIPDARAGDIRRGATNYLKSGDFTGAIKHFLDGAAHYINGTSITGNTYTPKSRSKSDDKFNWWLLIFIVIIFLLPGNRGGGGFYISSGGSRGGFGGGGGGSFGSSGGGFSGGGSSGSW